MPLPIPNLHTVDETGKYIVEANVDIPLKTPSPSISNDPRLVRANVYRPKAEGKYPILVTYGPYGKDVPYPRFHAKSFAEINPEHRSEHSALETPDPSYWTSHGYVIVRADERGAGQSPGLLDTMSSGTSVAFFDVVEWAAVQEWSSGKVGLLGISCCAGSQWRVAARRPKGLAAIVPWEGMSDYYRDRVRHGGILSNDFICKCKGTKSCSDTVGNMEYIHVGGYFSAFAKRVFMDMFRRIYYRIINQYYHTTICNILL